MKHFAIILAVFSLFLWTPVPAGEVSSETHLRPKQTKQKARSKQKPEISTVPIKKPRQNLAPLNSSENMTHFLKPDRIDQQKLIQQVSILFEEYKTDYQDEYESIQDQLDRAQHRLRELKSDRRIALTTGELESIDREISSLEKAVPKIKEKSAKLKSLLAAMEKVRLWHLKGSEQDLKFRVKVVMSRARDMAHNLALKHGTATEKELVKILAQNLRVYLLSLHDSNYMNADRGGYRGAHIQAAQEVLATLAAVQLIATGKTKAKTASSRRNAAMGIDFINFSGLYFLVAHLFEPYSNTDPHLFAAGILTCYVFVSGVFTEELPDGIFKIFKNFINLPRLPASLLKRLTLGTYSKSTLKAFYRELVELQVIQPGTYNEMEQELSREVRDAIQKHLLLPENRTRKLFNKIKSECDELLVDRGFTPTQL